MLTRRDALRFGIGLPLGLAATHAWGASKNFWDTKEPADWSSNEIQQLLTRSPWARETNVSADSGQSATSNRGMGGNRGGIGGIGGGMGGGVGGGIGGGLGGGRVGGGGPMGGGPMGGNGGGNGAPGGGRREQYQALIRWDSALPIREALHAEPPDAQSSSYIVSLIGDLPGLGGRSRGRDDDDDRGDNLDALREYSKLARKENPIFASKVEQAPNGSGIMFYFPRSEPISMDDKTVEFVTSLNNRVRPIDVRVKFSLKDMTYRGKLEL